MSHQLSVVIISHNEEKFIADAVKSASFADEVLVLDSGSTDETRSIAKNLGAKVMHQEWLGFGMQKNKAVELASNDWVFVLDSDERITPELQIEILNTLKNPMADGYYVARLNNFFGKYIRHCGLYPDCSIRLFNRQKGKFNDVTVHESVQIQGKTNKLKNHMLHFAFDTVEEFYNKQKKYAALSQKKKNLIKAFISPIWTFLKIYIVRLGFLEGWRGFVIAKVYAQYTFWKYYK
ncbi:MAG: glycosyltransferase family 2 protein [Proteobacteria bacterium]|nr:glycosyltransferase family 2 protein [Pseudomonadota bacterium]MCH9711352.1 glycosyltransferase family 2 protein [Pseudomonadota bacterium]MCH9749343.1 glycosyltransferase family 2 protein [Pseudomonadota bacterium]